MLTLEQFRENMSGGESRQQPGQAVTYILIEDPDGNEIFYTEWPFESEQGDEETAKERYAIYKHEQESGKKVFFTRAETPEELEEVFNKFDDVLNRERK